MIVTEHLHIAMILLSSFLHRRYPCNVHFHDLITRNICLFDSEVQLHSLRIGVPKSSRMRFASPEASGTVESLSSLLLLQGFLSDHFNPRALHASIAKTCNKFSTPQSSFVFSNLRSLILQVQITQVDRG